ncbi:Na+/H+ antiporter subunit E [Psychrobacillus psychrodurans]|jgi:multicomponent Na+:H+ antiporter subunit E|uniref:Na+/H+ antiporter subunit E n=1 Tax=Psychrobacillus TaxID=1221880 RepID=UPI0008F029CE|nr:Na+/H+ antiporter subunit E [Psychrobacillus psychrodurans]MCK1998609.1 Na+/H+ antiporter subunit E [Psychrobacillus psychrodurans]MCZ8540408.1 Na+/H+ antiporter subunit E [Psychrobacillus psychrodurans]SFM58859.1 multicomponent Na+:H+ antiporter subunit E [Psychrobacillus psychrodurans]
MAFQILLNVLIGLTWMFLSVSFKPTTFIVGYLLGLLMLFMLRKSFSSRFYMDRIWAVIKLASLFLKELLLSNLSVLKLIVQPTMPIRPAIFAMPTVLEQDWEITLLSSLITLTPGTVVIDISDDNKTLYIHSLDFEDIDEAVDSIRNTFEKAILEVSRS